MRAIHPDVEQILFSEEEIKNKCKELGEILTRDYKGKKPIIIGLLKGSVPFMAELIKNIDLDVDIDFMVVKSYVGATSTGNVRILMDCSVDVSGRDVIFCEDIVDTGYTLKKLVDNFLKSKNTASVEIVTLLDKVEGRKVSITPKYVGFEIPNKFVVGYGLDYNEKYRNLPYVGILKPEVYS